MSLRDERGFTLIELLTVMGLSLIILSATLATFTSLVRGAHDNDARGEATETARTSLDRQARQLRNVAKRVNAPVIDTVADYDFIFQTSDPERTWVRYCLDTTTAPGSARRGRLWEATSSESTLTAAMRGACPGSGWSATSPPVVVADFVTNRRDGLERSVFAYTCTSGTDSCTASASTYDQIVNVGTELMVDTRLDSGAPELKVATGVYLRNQNQRPEASFVSSRVRTRTILLNASSSSDFEGRTLTYHWFKGTMPTSIRCDQPTITTNAVGDKILWGGRTIGQGVTLQHAFPTTDGAAGASVSIGLVACDPGDRDGTAGVPPGATIQVPIPS